MRCPPDVICTCTVYDLAQIWRDATVGDSPVDVLDLVASDTSNHPAGQPGLCEGLLRPQQPFYKRVTNDTVGRQFGARSSAVPIEFMSP